MPAGELRSGEQIVREAGAVPATVTALRVVAGAADYYNLTVSVLHTYAVGDGQYVVHNCGASGNADTATYRGTGKYTDTRGRTIDFYEGQERSFDSGWTNKSTREDYYIDSPSFKQFIEDTHPGYTFRDGPDGDWVKVMETWKRGGVPRENHYWTGRKEFSGEDYHYHYSGDPRPVH